ncbi:ATP-binding protein [Teichococcus oryzae]|uniref:histidine kinase n=1 Tax=Teichococcus oryzae TaxID=1608942 RepID=A0A5B2TMC6_9PROT|nr:ATP-binding protein [Pseudoroseomonas oryzae]KAA2215058.1 HAMP domain-containing protein [Pseudoroseomonas oryzae]
MIRRLRPRSLAGRTALFLTLALMLVQTAGLLIHALDRLDLQRIILSREISSRAFIFWRTAVLANPDRRQTMLYEIDLMRGLRADLSDTPAVRPGMPRPPPPLVEMFQVKRWRALPPNLRPRALLVAGGEGPRDLIVASQLPDGQWVNLWLTVPVMRPWHSGAFLVAFLMMTGAALALIVWATRRLTRPVSALARAAEQLGRDVNSPPLPEDGPREVATAARAFNTMAERIRRFVGDRTQMLAAIGHDLRTPITRLRLRAEFLEDDEQRRKMLADLDEMETMVNATLAFARDDAATEPSVPLDLAALCRTVLDEAMDARPGLTAEAVTYTGPERLRISARPVALKRALANLVGNALNYGGRVRLRLDGQGPKVEGGLVRLLIEDEGPGIPDDCLEVVFQPFRRLETSRNRETGGTGLGLPIARNILRAHGGDVMLMNRQGGGLSALVTLPA